MQHDGAAHHGTSAPGASEPAPGEPLPGDGEGDDEQEPLLPPQGFFRLSAFDDSTYEASATAVLLEALASVGDARRQRAAERRREEADRKAAARRRRQKEREQKEREAREAAEAEAAAAAEGGETASKPHEQSGTRDGAAAAGSVAASPAAGPPADGDKFLSRRLNDNGEVETAGPLKPEVEIRGWSRWRDADGVWRWAPVSIESYDRFSEFFEVRWDETGKTKQVGRLNLMFATDDPYRFRARAESARRLQQDTEAAVRQAVRVAEVSGEVGPLPSESMVLRVLSRLGSVSAYGAESLAREMSDFLISYRDSASTTDLKAALPYSEPLATTGLPPPPPRLPYRSPAPSRGTVLDCPPSEERLHPFAETKAALLANLAIGSPGGVTLLKLARTELALVRQVTRPGPSPRSTAASSPRVHPCLRARSLTCLLFEPRGVKIHLLPAQRRQPVLVSEFVADHNAALADGLHAFQHGHISRIAEAFADELRGEYKAAADDAQRIAHYGRYERLAKLVNAMLRDALRAVATDAIEEFVRRLPPTRETAEAAAEALESIQASDAAAKRAAAKERRGSVAQGGSDSVTHAPSKSFSRSGTTRLAAGSPTKTQPRSEGREAVEAAVEASAGKMESVLALSLELSRPEPPSADRRALPPSPLSPSLSRRIDMQQELAGMAEGAISTSAAAAGPAAAAAATPAAAAGPSASHPLEVPALPPVPCLLPSRNHCAQQVRACLDLIVQRVAAQAGLRSSHLPPPRAGHRSLHSNLDEGELHVFKAGDELVEDARGQVDWQLEAHWALPDLLRTRCEPHAYIILCEVTAAIGSLHDGLHELAPTVDEQLAALPDAGRSPSTRAVGVPSTRASLPISAEESRRKAAELAEGMRQWLRSHTRELTRLNRSIAAASDEVFAPDRTLHMGLFSVAPTPLLSSLEERADALTKAAFGAVAASARQRHQRSIGRCTRFLADIASKPSDIEALSAQEAMLKKLPTALESMGLELSLARMLLDELYSAGVR